MNLHRPCWSSVDTRPGFTLLELILAIGLTSLLMATVYGAMSAYWNLALDSHEEIERTKIARSLLHKLVRDIQSCTFAEHGIQTDDDTFDEEETGTDTVEPAEAETSAYKNGLIGTERDLVLYISSPARELNYVDAPDAVGTVNRNSDLMIVRWLLAESNGGVLSSALAAKHAGNSDGSVAGLSRGSGGVTGFGQAIDNGDVSLQMQSTTLLAAEVQNVLFEYFDGVAWFSEWNSSVLDRMPRAIRIQLTLRTAPSRGDGDTQSPKTLPATTHSLVVPIPVASPYVKETAI